jgi:hypothetical protein
MRAASDELGRARRVVADEVRDGRLRHHQSRGRDPEIGEARNAARQALHQNAVALVGHDVEDDVKRVARGVAVPRVVRHHDAAVARGVARCDERAAMMAAPAAPGLESEAGLLLGRVRGPPALQQVHVAVPREHFGERQFRAVRDALNFVGEFGVELVGELRDGSLDEGVELFAGVPLRKVAGGADCVADFGCEQLAVLFAAIVRLAFDVQENPARLVAARGVKGRFAHLPSDRMAGVALARPGVSSRCRCRRSVFSL